MSAVDEKQGTFVSRPVTSSDLLQWAVINNATEKEDAPTQDHPVAPREPIDPKWIDVILGKPDAARMKECVETIQDSSKSMDDRLSAFDELEMLVESLDNANDLRNLGLWKPIIAILKSESEAELRAFAAWVMGTAVQNNPKAQKDFLDVEGLPVLLTALQNDSDPEVRAKCMTCLSGLVRHNPEAFKLLRASSSSSSTTSNLGLEPVLGLLTQTTNGNWSKAQKRAVFFLDGLISGSSGEEVGVIEKAVEDAKKNDWAGSVVSLLLKDDHLDSDLIEKCLSLLLHLVEHPVIASVALKQQVKQILPALLEKYNVASDLDEELVNSCKTVFQ